MTIPNSVTSIGEWAFYECSGLKNLTLGSGLQSIGSWAFASCKDLEKVICYAEDVPSTKTDAFKDSYVEYATLIVPDASIEKYKAADQWKDFGTIKGLEADAINAPEMRVTARPVLVSSEDGIVTIAGLADGEKVELYTTDGKLVNTTKAFGDTATCVAQKGAIIVKVGRQSIKVLVK